MNQLSLYPGLLFWLTLFCSFVRLNEDFPLVSNKNMSVKEIDGSALEGGGQIIRLSVALSCLLEQPIQIVKIRAGRAKPGLKPQHLAGIYLVKEMCKAITSGDHQSSNELSFKPQSLKMGNFNLNVNPKTAASISLMIQSVLPVAIFGNSKSTITMEGGTDVNFTPPLDYVKNVLFPIYHKLFGIACEVHINKRGFYPKGGGDVKLIVNPFDYNGYLKPIQMIDFGNKFDGNIKVIISLFGLPNQDSKKHQMGNSMEVLIKDKLRKLGYTNVTIEKNVGNSICFGGSIVLIANTEKCIIGSAVLYDEKQTTIDIVADVCDKLVLDLKAKSCVDANAMDNLIIFMALANGKSQVRCREITLHTETAIHVVEQFTNAKFDIIQTEDGLNEIVCEGIGFKRLI